MFLIFILANCFCSSDQILFVMGISTYITTKTCTNANTMDKVTFSPDDDSYMTRYCADVRDNPVWTCTEDIKQPYNFVKIYDLECKPNMKLYFSAIGVAFNIAMVFGSMVIGVILDKYGRRITFMIGGIAIVIMVFSIVFETNYYAFLVSFGMVGFANEFYFLPTYLLSIELVPKNKINQVGTFLNVYDALNSLFATIVYYLCYNSDYYLTYVGCRNFVVYLFLVYFSIESPYWLYSKGDIDECNKVLTLMARSAGSDEISNVTKGEVQPKAPRRSRIRINMAKSEDHLNPNDLLLQRNNNPEGVEGLDQDGIPEDSQWNCQLVVSVILMGFLWLSVVLSYYYMFYYAKYFPTNVFVTIMLESLACAVGYSISGLCIKWVGNKISLSACFISIILLSILYPFIVDYSIVLYAVIFLDIFCASFAFNVIYIMTPQYYYDDIVGKVFGFVNVLGRVGGIAAPIFSEFVAPNVLLIACGCIGLFCTVSIKTQKHYDPNWSGYNKKIGEETNIKVDNQDEEKKSTKYDLIDENIIN